MSETKLCPVCNGELHITYFSNGHEGVRCMDCEYRHSSNDNKVDK